LFYKFVCVCLCHVYRHLNTFKGHLHGKVQLMGVGTALKILLTPEAGLNYTYLKREEVVALFNTVQKLSHAIDVVDYLTELSLESKVSSPTGEVSGIMMRSIGGSNFDESVKSALREIATSPGYSQERATLAVFAKHYGADPVKFAAHTKKYVLAAHG
jgi:hypothetical protein